MIPYPASWLNAAAWEDEIQIFYADIEKSVIADFNEVLGDRIGTVDESIFIEKRASLIRIFLTLSEKQNFQLRYFNYIKSKCTLPPMVGFDWIVSRETFEKIKGGQFENRDRNE